MTALPTRPMNSRRLMQVSHKVQDNTEYASKHGHHALTARGMIAWFTVAGLGQKRTSHALFKDFIGAGEDRMRHGEPERLSSLEIEHPSVRLTPLTTDRKLNVSSRCEQIGSFSNSLAGAKNLRSRQTLTIKVDIYRRRGRENTIRSVKLFGWSPAIR